MRDTGAAAGEANVAEGLGVDPPPPPTRGGCLWFYVTGVVHAKVGQIV